VNLEIPDKWGNAHLLPELDLSPWRHPIDQDVYVATLWSRCERCQQGFHFPMILIGRELREYGLKCGESAYAKLVEIQFWSLRRNFETFLFNYPCDRALQRRLAKHKMKQMRKIHGRNYDPYDF